ncbi:hypothetical protein ANN_08606 [Periplaneta americana]|uniref:Reverse transcriptase domain-containing protein n=1 Tax=Periplaneta americana TaxID=6978 RepID=A0ABQ8T3G8_PERAM|nr:hypothetical protein ANN_08606 [Periplaneta americana]
MGGVIIGRIRIKCIRFADDMALLAEEEMILRDMLLELNYSCEQYGMKINVNKMKTMVTERKVKKKKEHLLRTSGELRKRLVKCFVWSVALYGAETWTLRRSEEKRIEAFEMWLWRRMEHVKWTDRIRNEGLLERVDKERIMLKLMRKRKRNWLGHWLRRNCLLKDALEGMANGRRVWGRRRYQMIDDIKIYESYEETKKKAENRKDWRMRVCIPNSYTNVTQIKIRHEVFIHFQTELGHGTYIRGLETTAHYHPETQEFVINSPTLSSYKWWPGGMGHTANYAVVAAQLYTQEVYRGVHIFIVQLRDEETHEPMPGMKIGEIGTKFGMHTINNGFLAFQNVHIPRDQMLMKNAKVLEDGSYVKSPSDKLVYGTMIYVRVVMLQTCAYQLGLAATIAIRYSAVRRQSEMKPG